MLRWCHVPSRTIAWHNRQLLRRHCAESPWPPPRPHSVRSGYPEGSTCAQEDTCAGGSGRRSTPNVTSVDNFRWLCTAHHASPLRRRRPTDGAADTHTLLSHKLRETQAALSPGAKETRCCGLGPGRAYQTCARVLVQPSSQMAASVPQTQVLRLARTMHASSAGHVGQ